MPCLSCQKSSSSPRNFLLNCISCANSWHHRCHSPPVSDKDLIGIIKAFNAAKPNNSAAKLIWQCSTCVKVKTTANQQNRQLIAVKRSKAIVIDIDQDDDDNDDIIALDRPPNKTSTNPELSHLSNAVAPRHSPTTLSRSKHGSSIAPPGRTPGTKDKNIRIINDPFLVPNPTFKHLQTPSNTKPQVISEFIDLTISGDEGAGSDDALEYVTPAPTSKPVVEVVDVEEVPLIPTSNQLTPVPSSRDTLPTAQTTMTAASTTQLTNHLLTRWLNDRRTTDGVKPDIWARACLRRDQDAADRKRGSKSAQPSIRRKYKAHSLNEMSLTHPRVAVFISAEGWLRDRQASLVLD